jgi:hypothetical protein
MNLSGDAALLRNLCCYSYGSMVPSSVAHCPIIYQY